MRWAERDCLAAKQERQSLGVSGISIDEARTAELEAACSALGDQQEPSVQAMQSRATYLRRTRQGSDAAALDGVCASLEQIAQDAGV